MEFSKRDVQAQIKWKTLRLTVPSQLVLNSNSSLGLMNLYKAMLSYSPSYQASLELEDIPRGKIV